MTRRRVILTPAAERQRSNRDVACASSRRTVCSRDVSGSRPSAIFGLSDERAPVQRYSSPRITLSMAVLISSVGTSFRM